MLILAPKLFYIAFFIIILHCYLSCVVVLINKPLMVSFIERYILSTPTNNTFFKLVQTSRSSLRSLLWLSFQTGLEQNVCAVIPLPIAWITRLSRLRFDFLNSTCRTFTDALGLYVFFIIIICFALGIADELKSNAIVIIIIQSIN